MPCIAACRRGVQSTPVTNHPVPELDLGERSPGDRLDSWKEIGAYLRRDVTTVQRWERREAMPLHRHLHDKQGSVHAFRTELDLWAQSRLGRQNGDRPPAGSLPPQHSE